MRRTQIYLTAEEWRTLAQKSRGRRTTMASLIREAIDTMYLAPSMASFVRALHEAAGLWRHRTDLPSTERYVRTIREKDRRPL